MTLSEQLRANGINPAFCAGVEQAEEPRQVDMQERFRFRVWDKERHCWLGTRCVIGRYGIYEELKDQALWNPERSDTFVLMQCTGLKDKNGALIYEGDVISFTVFDFNDHDEQYSGVVKYSNAMWEIWHTASDPFYGSDGPFVLGYVFPQDSELAVIGNIYENPQLSDQE